MTPEIAASPSPRPTRRGAWAVWGLLVVLLLASLFLFWTIHRIEDRLVEQQFSEQARDRVRAIEASIEDSREIVLFMDAFFEGSHDVERSEFRVFTEGILARHADVVAVGWLPRVSAAERGAFEESVRGEGFPSYRIFDLGKDGTRSPSPERPELFPILYSEPTSTQEAALGIDLSGNPQIRSAMDAARVGRTDVLSAPEEIPALGKGPLLRFLEPVYHDDPSAEAGHRVFIGFVACVVSADRFLEGALSSLAPVGIDVEVIDKTEPGRPIRVARRGSGDPSVGLTRTEDWAIAGRRWTIRCDATPAYASGKRPLGAWVVLGICLVLTAVLTTSLRRAHRRAADIAQVVEERTAELRRLTAILDSTPDFVAIATKEGRSLYVNPAGRRMIGMDLDAPVGGEAARAYPPWAYEILMHQAVPATLRDGTWSGEMALLHRDGREIPVSKVVIAHRDASGRLICVSTIARDMSERKRIEEATIADYNRRLEAAMSDLRRSQELVSTQERLRALGQMASGIAHDFNNALSPVLGFTELLLNDEGIVNDREKLTHFLRSILTAAGDAASVVRRLKEFYRPRGEKEPRVPVDLNRLVEGTLGLTQPRWKDQAQAANAPIEVRRELGEIPPVAAAAAELREALTNVILNAIDAMPSGGTLTLSTHRDGEMVNLSVRDTGTGMTEEVRRRCLEPFFTTKGEAGTGMGLAMVYGILVRHEGSIEIDSEPGKGTTVRLRLPACRLPEAERRRETARRTRRMLRVLVVDDEPMIREVVKSFLELDQHVVETATNGREGWERFQKVEVDLVVTDSAMPEMSGEALAAKVKEARAGVPVLLMTGFGDVMQATNRKPASVDQVLSKPVTIESLRRAIAGLMASS